jgi:hypothetical protein
MFTLKMLVELGLLVAFGVLLDALLVRSVLVPALTPADRPADLVAEPAVPTTGAAADRAACARGGRRVRAATVSAAARTRSGTGPTAYSAAFPLRAVAQSRTLAGSKSNTQASKGC